MRIIILNVLVLETLILGCQSNRPRSISELVPLAAADVVATASRVEVKQFLPNAYVVFHHMGKKVVNSLLVEMGSGELILVDAPVGEKAVQSLMSWIDYRLGKRKIIAILTSHRWDRSGGVGTLIGSGVPVYGSKTTAELIRRTDNSATAAAFQVADASAVAPDHLFNLKDGLHLKFQGERVDVIFPGKGYAPDNLVVHFPDYRLVFAGGLIGQPQGSLKSWANALKKVQKLSYEWLVPAEGRKLSPYLLDNALRTFESEVEPRSHASR